MTKSKKDEKENIEYVQDKEYAQNFAKVLNSSFNNSMISPQMQNQLLQSLSVNKFKYSKSMIAQMLSDPQNNEKGLRDLSEFMFVYIQQIKRMVIHFSRMLTYDWYLRPTNADEDDMKKTVFKKSEQKAYQWIEDFELKHELPLIVEGMILNDAKFYYLRESENGIRLQELPSDYCVIYAKNDLGYQFYFNMSYFLSNPNASLDNFPPEFTEYYNQMIGTDGFKKNQDGFRTGRYGYYQPLDPEKAWVFKFHERFANIIPPLSGVFLDALDILEYKDLLKAKSELDVWKLLVAKIPMNKGNNSGNKRDDFAIDSGTAAMFASDMQKSVPNKVKVMVTPLETEAFTFEKTGAEDSLISIGNNNFRESAGIAPVLSGSTQLNSSSAALSIKADEIFIKSVYKQFERFINFQLKKNTGKYRFKIHLEGTEFDKKDRIASADAFATLGGDVTHAIVARGYTVPEFINIIKYENSIGLKDMMRPLQSSFNSSSDKADSNGAPTKDLEDMTDEGIESRDKG